MNDNKFLEQFYECVILPRYEGELKAGKVTWLDHGKIDADAWAHHFKIANSKKQYVLLYEDFPDGAYFKDGLSHELVKCSGEATIELRFSDDAKQVPNITGWYTLYREK